MLTLLAALEPILNTLKTIFGIGGLIFVHELGHFLVGRWCGVRAEVFSIGFGPALFKWTPGNTEYRIAPIPLGGYVKFLGENPDEEGQTASDSFMAASYPRKAAIMLAGVVMNVIAAFVLFVWTFSIGVDLPTPVVGTVEHGMPAWEYGVQVGDEIVTIDGKEIIDFRDVIQDVALADAVDLELRRDGELLPAIHIPTAEANGGLRRLGIGGSMEDTPTIRVLPESAAAAAGLLDGDQVVAFDGTEVDSAIAALRLYSATHTGTFTVERDGERVDVKVTSPTETAYLIGVRVDGLAIGVVQRDGAAAAAGVRKGDRPVEVDGTPVATVEEMFDLLRAEGAAPTKLTVERDGARVEIPIGDDVAAFAASLATGRPKDRLIVSPHLQGEIAGPALDAGMTAGARITAAAGSTVEVLSDLSTAVAEAGENDAKLRITWVDASGAEHTADVAPVAVENPGDPGMGVPQKTHVVQEKDVLAAVALGVRRTDRWVTRILTTLTSLFSGKVSAKNLSGPIEIARATYSQAETGLGQFLLFLGFISMNLAVLNLLPIPMLDGGQLAMFTAERIRGRPLPESVQAGLQWAGLILLLGLMVFVVANDISKL